MLSEHIFEVVVLHPVEPVKGVLGQHARLLRHAGGRRVYDQNLLCPRALAVCEARGSSLELVAADAAPKRGLISRTGWAPFYRAHCLGSLIFRRWSAA